MNDRYLRRLPPLLVFQLLQLLLWPTLATILKLPSVSVSASVLVSMSVLCRPMHQRLLKGRCAAVSASFHHHQHCYRGWRWCERYKLFRPRCQLLHRIS
jgi:hypothetical protein